MAKDSKKNNSSAPAFTPPAGMVKRNDDIVGFWMAEQPITFIPRGAKLFDNKQERRKPSILIICETLETVDVLRGTGDDGEIVTAQPGDIIGIWGKPGMKALANCAGVKTWMAPAGEKDIGKQKPMKLFEVYSDDGGQRLPILEDKRVASADEPTFLDVAGSNKGSGQSSFNIDDIVSAPPRG